MINIRKAQREDVPVINRLLNLEIVNTNYNLSTRARTDEEAEKWFDMHIQNNYPVIVAELEGNVVGWASLSPFRTYGGYDSTAEVSIYVAFDYRHRGIATMLMNSLFDMAGRFHCLIAVISKENNASISLHSKCGFQYNTELKEMAFKNGGYVDIVLMTKIIE